MGEHPPPLNLCGSLPSDAKAVYTDLFDAVKQAAADGATVSEMQTTVAEQLAPQYEAGMSKYPRWAGIAIALKRPLRSSTTRSFTPTNLDAKGYWP